MRLATILPTLWIADPEEPQSARPTPPPSDRADTAPPASPCPEIEARFAALAAAGPVEMEPESGPVTRRGLDLVLAAYVAGEGQEEGERVALLPPPWAPRRGAGTGNNEGKG